MPGLFFMAKGTGSYIKKSYRGLLSPIAVCAYCGQGNATHIDHIIPPKNGGDSSLKNLTKACPNCNGSKTDLTISEFLIRTERKRDTVRYSAQKIIMVMARLKRLNRQHEINPKEIDKLKTFRLLHSRYCAIIGSLISGKYIIHG